MMETERRERDGTFFVVQLKSIGNVVCENPPEKLEVRDISAQWNTIMVHAKHLSHNDTIYQSGVKCNKFSVYTSVSHPCTSNSSTSIDLFIYFSRSCYTETKADARAPLPFHFNSIFVDFCKWFSLFTQKKEKHNTQTITCQKSFIDYGENDTRNDMKREIGCIEKIECQYNRHHFNFENI